jgi:hypothetical protein
MESYSTWVLKLLLVIGVTIIVPNPSNSSGEITRQGFVLLVSYAFVELSSTNQI